MRCVCVEFWERGHMHHDTSVLIQAALWNGLFDSKHEKNVRLAKELAVTKLELRNERRKNRDTLWALHEISNGAGHAAINLYNAGELQKRIPYFDRNQIGERIWTAKNQMDREQRDRAYPRPGPC